MRNRHRDRAAGAIGSEKNPRLRHHAEMLALARKRCAGLDVDFREADLAKPLAWLADASVDRILCTLALDHLEYLAAVFAEFHRVTRRGGRLVFSMSHPMRDWQDERAQEETVPSKPISGAWSGPG